MRYLAFYFWIQNIYQADAIAHIGKHGNLEWLPGKSVALSAQCWSDIVIGPLPHLYPFIVNDPGEGAQAKRRAQAVILDHLMPPMARAEIYGELLELEILVDEYYQAMNLDSRRESHIRKKIVQLVLDSNLSEELNLNIDTSSDDNLLLDQIDTYLCDLKEAQIRHGLHRYGQLSNQEKLTSTLVALTRLPRGEEQHDAGILHCLSQDLNLLNGDNHSFNPLEFDPGALWKNEKPQLLKRTSSQPWRTFADTRERLELLAEECIAKMLNGDEIDIRLPRTSKLISYIKSTIYGAVQQSVKNEIDNFIGALRGRFVPAGPSGAPTRGRLDVLPTGRNFYSVDSRSIPTQSAWELGQLSAEKLILRPPSRTR